MRRVLCVGAVGLALTAALAGSTGNQGPPPPTRATGGTPAPRPPAESPAQAAAQEAPPPAQPAPQQPTFRVGATLVRVDAFVTKNGEPVADLTADDFKILEDGVPQAIRTFEYVNIPPGRMQTGERRDPQTVAVVTNTLASFYIEENLKARERQATGTAEFLKVQLAEAKKRLDDQESRMGELQRRYLGELPQQLQGNLGALDSLNTQLRINNDNLVRLAERRDTLAAQLAQAKLSTGGPEPDEVRLARLKQELITLRVKYTDLWPDIIRIKDEIERLEKLVAEPKPKVQPKEVAGPPTPEAARLQDALRSIEIEVRLGKQDDQRLRQAILAYQARVDNAPKREQEYLDATRDYQGTRELYQNLSRKYDDALLAESMEQRQKGEQFRILDSALPSWTPAAPRRSRLLMLSLVLSFALGAGSMILMELLDTSFHSTRDLRAYTTVPVLVSIPRIVTEGDARRHRWRFRLAAVGVLVGLVVVGGSAYLFGHGNEQLAQILSRGDRA